MQTKRRVPVLLISGLAANAGRTLTDRLAEPGAAVVEYNLRGVASGVVRRRLWLGPRDQLTSIELAHGCVSCTMRADLLPLLRELAGLPPVRRIVVRLDEVMEPEQVCWELHHVLVDDRPVTEYIEVEAVVTAIDAASWLDDATGDDTLDERGLCGAPEDERTVAQVALSQVEFADVLVVSSSAPDAWSTAKTGAVLDRIAPSAPILHLSTVDSFTLRAAIPAGARRGQITDPHGALLHGRPPLEADCGVSLLGFSAQRPFHPARLHEAIDVLLDGVVRTRGRAWVASQPDTALWIGSAGGGLGVGHAGPWLDAPDGPAWEDVSPERRTMAALRWDPIWGDRAQELVIVTHQADPADIEEALEGALLTDDELAAGREVWAHYPDPFGEWHEEPCDETATDRAIGARSGEDHA